MWRLSKIIDSNSKENRKFNNRVPIPGKILDELYDHLIIKLEKRIPGFELKLTKNKELIFKTSKYTITFYYRAYDNEYILLNLHDCEYWELLELLPYDLELFENDRNLIDRFCQELQQSIEQFYPELFIFDPTLDQSSQIRIEENLQKTDLKTAYSVGSDPQIKSNRIDLEGFRSWIDQEKDRYGLIFSKEACIHRFDVSAKLDLKKKPDKDLLDSLVKGWKLNFDLKNGQATAFNMKNWGFSLVFRRNKIKNTASFRFRKRRRVTWDVIVESLRKNANFLTQESFIRFFELIQEQIDPGQVYIHRSHMAFPEDIVKRYFLGATVRIKDVYRNGRLEDVIVYFDMSDFAEFEGEGPAAQVNAIVGLVTNSEKAAHTVGIVDSKVDSLISEAGLINNIVQNNGDTLTVIQQEMLPQSHFDDKIENIELSNAIALEEIRGYSAGLKRVIKKHFSAMSDMQQQNFNYQNQNIDNFQSIQSNFKGVLEAIDEFDNSFNEHIDVKFLDVRNELYSQANHLHDNINDSRTQIIEKLENVKDEIIECIESNFKNSRDNSKFYLTLVLKQIRNSQEISVKEIQEKLNIKRSTLYNYLKQLQDKKLILPGAADPSGPGRPPKKFKINLEKLKKWRK